ncbi:MAG: class I SAM-dependent methyltransferase [Planctomycetota bacterium]
MSKINSSVMKFFLYMLCILLPKWLAADIRNYFTHPYWRKRYAKTSKSTRVKSDGITNKVEKVSVRRPFKRANRQKVLHYLRRENVQSILDVGCGVGNLVEELTREGYDSYGITINPQEIRQAGDKKIFLHDIQSSLGDSRLAGMQFDAILSFDCLEHLEAPLIALKNINKLLKANGLFISYIPAIRWIECDYHIIVYSPRQFRWLLNLAGFDLIEKDGRYNMSKKGVVYYARKVRDDGPVYPGILE